MSTARISFLCLTFVTWSHAVALDAPADKTLPKGHFYFQDDFDRPDALESWSGSAELVADGQGGQALYIERPKDAGRGSSAVEIALPAVQMRGYIVQFAARVRAEDVSSKPNAWNGVKFMAPWQDNDGKMQWPSVQMEAGSFDWRRVAFRVAVPAEAKTMSLVLGLELVTGRAWFDDVRVTVYRPIHTFRGPVTTGPAFKGHSLPRLRGAMVGPRIDTESLREFGREWNANLIRWQLIRRGPIADPLDMDAFDRWLHEELARLDQLLPVCQEAGLLLVLDLHSPPGGRQTQGGYAGSDYGLFNNAACQQKFVEVWHHIARRYKSNQAIWAYDLANEPVESDVGEDLDDWHALAERAAKAIRAIDPQRAIIVEPSQWGSPSGLKTFEPIDVPNVVYSVHMYAPHSFTHQNVHSPTTPITYPGQVDGRMWDKRELEKTLAPVVEFQKRYNVHIYIGEFSAIRWAPDKSAYRYLRDVIDIFEAHGWDWTYHAFREWDGWSVEHGPDRGDHSTAATPTDREELLRSWYAKNAKNIE